MSSQRQAPIPTIAVVAVPGAGDHAPGRSAGVVADLLLRLRSWEGTRYGSFVERPMRIPTRPARVNPRSAPNVAPDLRWSMFAEQHPFLRTQLQYGGAAARDREEDSPDHQLMRAQLAEYRSTGAPYETVRLEGERLAEVTDTGTREVQARLHVYEVGWSDLSRSASRMLRPLAELYQLGLHIADLGRMALDHARLEHSASPLWRAYGTVHTWAVRLVMLLVPAILVAIVATLGGALVPQLLGDVGIPIHVGVAVWVIAAGRVIHVAFRAYERVRPGALIVGVGAYVVGAVGLVIAAVRSSRADELLVGAIRVFELQAVIAGAALWALYLAGAVAGVLALASCVRTTGGARRRAWRAARTACATLAISGTSVLTAMFVVLAFGCVVALTWLPGTPYAPVLPLFGGDGQTVGAFLERVVESIAGAALPVLVLGAGSIGAMVALTVLPVLVNEIEPPREIEGFELGANGTHPPRRDAPIDTEDRWGTWERLRRAGDASQRLAQSVSRAMRRIASAGVMLYALAFFIAPAAAIAYWSTGAWPLAVLHASGTTIILIVGGALVVTAIALVTIRGRFTRLGRGVGPAIDVLIEMDKYLRTRPQHATPRARIAERYVSVLRYLCHWRDSTGRPYDAIVIVAHSQGAVITADLLNFVQREEDAELEPLRRPLANGLPDGNGRRLFLFTMGSPLRQLYSAWFPHLFSWVRGETGDGVSRPLPAVPREPWMLLPRLEDGHRVVAPAIPDGVAPDPYAMGVTRWVNAYRSGDYVGRAQWRQAVDGCDWTFRQAPSDAATRFVTDVPPVTYVSEDAHRSRRELCIGAGAHTGYLDATGKAIAVELDLLITDAMRMATRVSKDAAATAEGMES
jgi:hypothetical protein